MCDCSVNIIYGSSARWHGLMGLIETKTAEREFRLTVEMRDDFNELPKQWKIYPFIRLNGSHSLTLAPMPNSGICVPHPFKMYADAEPKRNESDRSHSNERQTTTGEYAGILTLVLNPRIIMPTYCITYY